ncbi:MAG: histidine kinase dimerization/phospho-acceptor domain-containing protein [Bacteroidales bacterium]
MDIFRQKKKETNHLISSIPIAFSRFKIIYDEELVPVDLLIQETNDEFDTLFGKDKKQFSGSKLSQVSPEFAKRLSNGIRESIYKIASKPHYETEIYIESRNTWYDIFAKIVDTDSLVVLYSDSSKRKIVEQELIESHKTFKNLYENAAIGLFRVSVDGTIVMANKTFHQILGIASYQVLMEEDDAHFGKNALRKKLPNETNPKNKSVFETYWEDNNGQCYHLLESYNPVKDKNGNLLYFEGIIENISDRKAAENQILELNNLFAELGVNTLKNIQLIVKKTNEILNGTVSIFYQRDKGRDALVTWPQSIFDLEETDETVNKNSLCFEIKMNGIEKVEVIPDLIKTDFYQTDLRIKKYGFRSFIGYPVILDGSTIGSLCMVDSKPRSFTHTEVNIIQTLSTALSLELKRKKLEENLRDARNEAEIANKAKTQFLANMSHELRTPLNGILGFSEMLIEFETDDKKLEMLEMIEKSGDQLLQIINDIFDYSKLEAGKLTLSEEEFELREMVSGIVKF